MVLLRVPIPVILSTEQEIQAVLDALGNSLGGITSFSAIRGNDTDGLNLSVSGVPIDINLNTTAPCQSGGTISFDGSMNGDVDDQTGQGSIDVDFNWGLNNCAVPSQNQTITLQGDPSIRFQASFTLGSDTFAWDGSQTGGFSYSISDGRAGSCAIDLTFTSTINTTTGAASGGYNGTICGVQGSAFGTFGGTS